MNNNRAYFIILLSLLLVACVPVANPGPFAAQATANAAGAGGRAVEAAGTSAGPQAAVLQATAVSVQATAQAAVIRETAVSQAATRDYYDSIATATAVSAQATQQADAATREAQAQATAAWQSTISALEVREREIGINATATAVARIAAIDALDAADQAVWYEQQAQARALALQRQATWAQWQPFVFGAAVLAIVLAGIAAAAAMWRSSQPVVDVRGEVLALPSGRYQLMPGARVTAPATAAPPPPQLTISAPLRELPATAEGHILVVGPTRSGKSTAFRALIKARQNVTVIDPHYAQGDWRGTRVIGAGGDIEAIETQLRYMEEVLNRRMDQLAQDHTWKRRFEPMTVVTDELPLLASKVKPEAMRVWHRWLREGWKFKLYFVVGTQSTRVKTLGIEGEGDVLDNVHATLYLGDAALAEFGDIAAGMQRPAIWRESGRPHPQPVIIPYHPDEDPDSPQFRPAVAPLPQPAPRPLLEAPLPQPLELGNGEVATPEQVTAILQAAREEPHRTAVERRVFGYDGGQAYRVVKFVLDYYGVQVGR